MDDRPPLPDNSATRLGRLALTDFRNHARLDLNCDALMVVITGANGAGKTNILEAVSLLVPGRGLRRAPLAQMARQGGGGGFAVQAELLPQDISIGTGASADAPGRRQVRINGADASANGLSEWLAAIWLTPAMDRLFLEGASERRRFLDRLVLALEPSHGRATTRYEAAMRERNRLLTDDRPADPAWLDALEARMAEYGAAIGAARSRLIAALAPRLADAPEGPFARPLVALIDGGEDGAASSPDPDALARTWREGRARDRAAGRTLAGPHRADIAVTHAATGQEAALCSTGEQKALLLSIMLAHAALVEAERGQAPLILLDEVAAHLDAARRASLIERLDALSGQVWVTGTDRALFSAAEGTNALFLSLPLAG